MTLFLPYIALAMALSLFAGILFKKERFYLLAGMFGLAVVVYASFGYH